MRRVWSAGVLCLVLTTEALAADRTAGSTARRDPPVPDPNAAAAFLATIRPSASLQSFLDQSVKEIAGTDPRLVEASPKIAVIDLRNPAAPVIADVHGSEKVYPASVVKFVYLMAAYAWQERGLVTIDAELDRELSEMIRESSNQATQKVFARLTGTEPGPELGEAEYAAFRERRLAIKRWVESLGIDDLHTVSPTYDGGGDLAGRDRQFLRDRTITGGLAARGGEYPNRQAMTASGTARMLALLATDRALAPEDSETVRRRMLRDIHEQPHLAHRIAGGAAPFSGTMVFSKSGTWGPIYADAGIVRDRNGRQFVLAFFTDANPPYRGEAIARLTRRLVEHLLDWLRRAAEGGPA